MYYYKLLRLDKTQERCGLDPHMKTYIGNIREFESKIGRRKVVHFDGYAWAIDDFVRVNKDGSSIDPLPPLPVETFDVENLF